MRIVFDNLDLKPNEVITFKLHFAHSSIEGVILGILLLNQFVFIRSLNGSSYLLGVLFQFSVVAFIFLIIFNEFIRRTKNKKNLLRKVSIITRLPLIIFLFFPVSLADINGSLIYQYIFLFVFLVFYLSDPIIFPVRNLLLKTNYSHKNFGKLYSYSVSVNSTIALVTAFVYGYLLDLNNFIFIYVFPIMGLLGIISIFLLSKINYEESNDEIIKISIFSSILKSLKNIKNIIINDKSFRDFEIGFMLYGFSFMITVTIITLFFDEILNLNYSSVAFYKNSYLVIAIILTPFFGRLIGKIDPRRFAIYTYVSMILSIVGLILTDFYPIYIDFVGIRFYWMIIIYIIFYGVFTTTMALLWHIGSAYFCNVNETDIYQSIHLSATGLRGLFAPLLGVFILELIGFSGTFIVAIVSLCLAILVMIISYKKNKLKTIN